MYSHNSQEIVGGYRNLAVDSDRVNVCGCAEIIVLRVQNEQRGPKPALSAAGDKDRLQNATQQLGLDEVLAGVPGLYMQNRYNFSQDLRIAIRGFGTRSSFGIRGIKILVDNIPETLPDGQAQVDSIDLGSAERIEVLRGPAALI